MTTKGWKLMLILMLGVLPFMISQGCKTVGNGKIDIPDLPVIDESKIDLVRLATKVLLKMPESPEANAKDILKIVLKE